uniref:BZIP domain-containing protein n=1 Tax=Acrobeloides nanus TaxID=290746 RepID=A0A914CFM8_9BILA
MYQNSNWPNGYYCNTNSSNNHEPYFQVTTNEVSYEIFPPNNNPNSNVPQANTNFDRSYTYSTVSYPTYPPPPYKPPTTTISPIVQSNDSGYTPITPTESIASTDKAPSESKKKRKRRTEDKVLSIKKESICKKHARHATLEEQKRCEENRIRNREASRRSRQKKIVTIDKQREEIDQLKVVISQKDVLINQILRQHKLLSDRLQFLESQMIPINKQQTYEIKQNVRENHMMGPPSQQNQNMTINARAMEAIEAENCIDRILDDMNKMVMDNDLQNALEISTPILRQAIQHVLKPSEPILEEPKKLNEEIAESEMEQPAENEEEENDEDEYEPRPDCLCLGDDEESDQDELMTTPGTVTVSVKETVINSPIFRMKIHSVQSTSPIQYRTLTNK